MNKKIFVRIKGGVGNQLFQFAMAYRLAHYNNADLVIDDISGFKKDFKYKRTYQLDKLNICNKTVLIRNYWILLFIIKLIKYISISLPEKYKLYLDEKELSFDKTVLHKKIFSFLYVEGYWQSEKYFFDVKHTLLNSLTFQNYCPPQKLLINSTRNTVAIHIRFFNPQNDIDTSENLESAYYKNALDYISAKLDNPFFFVFCDNIEQIKDFEYLNQLKYVKYISSQNPLDDLFLMSICENLIIANSTFSWWAAWLCKYHKKIIIAPSKIIKGKTMNWGFNGLIPDSWIKL